MNTGQIANNTIQGYGLSPTTNVYIIPSCCEKMPQYLTDFTMPAVLSNNTSVTTSSNVTNDSLIANASTASYSPKVAVGSLAFAYAPNLLPAVTSVISAILPLPTTLQGVTVSVTDSAGATRLAPIVYISPSAVSYVIPDGTATGNATVSIGSFTGGAQIDTLAPSFYSANSSGQGVAAANALLYSSSPNPVIEPVFQCGSTAGSCASVPIDPGLDQINILVPRSLSGEGEVSVIVRIDGQTANVVNIRIK